MKPQIVIHYIDPETRVETHVKFEHIVGSLREREIPDNVALLMEGSWIPDEPTQNISDVHPMIFSVVIDGSCVWRSDLWCVEEPDKLNHWFHGYQDAVAYKRADSVRTMRACRFLPATPPKDECAKQEANERIEHPCTWCLHMRPCVVNGYRCLVGCDTTEAGETGVCEGREQA